MRGFVLFSCTLAKRGDFTEANFLVNGTADDPFGDINTAASIPITMSSVSLSTPPPQNAEPWTRTTIVVPSALCEILASGMCSTS